MNFWPDERQRAFSIAVGGLMPLKPLITVMAVLAVCGLMAIAAIVGWGWIFYRGIEVIRVKNHAVLSGVLNPHS